MKKVVLYFSLFVGAIVLLSFELHAQPLDVVIFGDETSETEHSLDQRNTTVGLGGLDESFRKLDGDDIDSSYLGVTLSLDPEVQNYLTIKLWGSDTLERRKNLFLHYYKTFFGALGRWEQIGSSGTDTPEIVNWSNTSIYPNRFVYVTYLLPEANGLEVQFSYGESAESLKPIGKKLSLIVIADGQGYAMFNGPGVGMYATSNGEESKNEALFDWFYYKGN